MRLLMDQGNTRAKLALQEGRDIRSLGALDGGPTEEGLRALLPQGTGWTQVLAVSVASAERRAALADAVRRATGVEPRFLGAPARGDGLVNAYDPPQRLGADRWYAMVGARHHVSGPFCVVCAGTALTLDAVDGEGRHLGGLILPGLGLSRDALARGTGGLPAVSSGTDGADPASGLATDTVSAIRSGQAVAAAALAERQAAMLDKLADAESTIVVTGGDADAVLAWIRGRGEALPDLVLRGLAVTEDGGTEVGEGD